MKNFFAPTYWKWERFLIDLSTCLKVIGLSARPFTRETKRKVGKSEHGVSMRMMNNRAKYFPTHASM